MKEKLKNTKGITLIALIMTIIVLIILAIVSIKLVMDSEIITHSETATKKYSVEEEQEKIKLGLAASKMASVSNSGADLTVDGATVNRNATNGWKVTFDGTGNVYTVDADGNITKGGATTPPSSGEATYYNISFKTTEELSNLNWESIVGTDGTEYTLVLMNETGTVHLITASYHKDGDYYSLCYITPGSGEYIFKTGDPDYALNNQWDEGLGTTAPTIEPVRILTAEEIQQLGGGDMTLFTNDQIQQFLNITAIQ